eukprot:TRINITY_DN4300_c0_g1_i1.p1 TRINITY_DN4300_c0_g1~~TRINITY_DN4300_c0_g1_i1.p1  ORF type:complete len:322 (+),score=56.58 TRINITY_DN4300_c0_g1_i1:89-1054(+)
MRVEGARRPYKQHTSYLSTRFFDTLTSLETASEGLSSNESSRTSSRGEREAENSANIPFPNVLRDHKRLKGWRKQLTPEPAERRHRTFWAEAIKEEAETEENRRVLSRLRVMSDHDEFANASNTRTQLRPFPILARRSSEQGVLPNVPEDCGHEDDTRQIALKLDRVFLEDKDEFNQQVTHLSSDIGRRRSFCASLDSEEVIPEEEDAGDRRQSKMGHPHTFTPAKVDELDRKRIVASPEAQSPLVGDVIEEERPEREDVPQSGLSAVANQRAREKEYLARIVRGERLGDWDTAGLEYIEHETVSPVLDVIPEELLESEIG